MTKINNTIELLNINWDLLQNSIESLNLSVIKCKKIGFKHNPTFEEMESFDSLILKFARTSDIYIQKILRGIWILLHEPYAPLIDMLNKSEKAGIIYSADKLLEIRELKNHIAYEYIPETVNELVKEVIV